MPVNRPDSRPDGEPTVKLAPPYSIQTSLLKGLKVGSAAAVGWLLADPNLLTALTEAVPFKYRMFAALAVPMVWSAAKNWVKQNQGTTP